MAGEVEIQPTEFYLTVDELIERWKGEFSRGHLSDMRMKGSGPPFAKFGAKTVLYPLSLLVRWDAEHLDLCLPIKQENAQDKSHRAVKGLHLTPEELAERWHLTEGTLSNWRTTGEGPQYMKFGKRVLYPITEVEAFERRNLKAAVHVDAKS